VALNGINPERAVSLLSIEEGARSGRGWTLGYWCNELDWNLIWTKQPVNQCLREMEGNAAPQTHIHSQVFMSVDPLILTTDLQLG